MGQAVQYESLKVPGRGLIPKVDVSRICPEHTGSGTRRRNSVDDLLALYGVASLILGDKFEARAERTVDPVAIKRVDESTTTIVEVEMAGTVLTFILELGRDSTLPKTHTLRTEMRDASGLMEEPDFDYTFATYAHAGILGVLKNHRQLADR